jgi:hypothetical protein
LFEAEDIRAFSGMVAFAVLLLPTARVVGASAGLGSIALLDDAGTMSTAFAETFADNELGPFCGDNAGLTRRSIDE